MFDVTLNSITLVPACGIAGFTGTIAWADPKYNLIYIFLCNRVYPSAEENTLAKQNIRPKIQQLIYDAIKK